MASDWIVAKLGDVLEIKYGKDHKKLNDGDIPCFGSGGLMRYVENSIYEKESILIPRKGSLNNIYYVDQPFWTVDTLFWTKINLENVFPKFLFYQLRLTDFVSLNVGSAVPSLTVPVLNDLKIKLPPLPEQKAIAHILSSLDNKIELNRRMNETLEAMAQALFKSWFVDFDPVIDNALAAGNAIPDEFFERAEQRKGIEKKDNSEIQSLFPDEFEFTEEMGWIPKGWESVKLDKLLEVKYGKDHKKLDEGTIPVYGSGGLMRHVNKSLYIGESILIPRKGTLSNLMFVDEEFWTVDTMFFSIPKFSNIAKYIFHHLKLLDLTSMNVGSAVPSMTTKVLNDLDILYPCENTLKEFNRLVTDFYNRSSSLNSQNETLAKLRDTLLPKLMSGELRIADAAALVDEAI